jgi:hypothetical protein
MVAACSDDDMYNQGVNDEACDDNNPPKMLNKYGTLWKIKGNDGQTTKNINFR